MCLPCKKNAAGAANPAPAAFLPVLFFLLLRILSADQQLPLLVQQIGEVLPVRGVINIVVLHTEPFCMGRTVDFSCRMLYDKNGFARTQSRIIESCPRMPCGGYRKGRKTARCLPKRNGAKEPHANGTVGARMHRSGLGRRDESPPLGETS